MIMIMLMQWVVPSKLLGIPVMTAGVALFVHGWTVLLGNVSVLDCAAGRQAKESMTAEL